MTPITILKAKGETPRRFRPFCVIATSNTPRKHPITEPRPPPNRAPPRTAAARTSSSRPTSAFGTTSWTILTCISPPTPAIIPIHPNATNRIEAALTPAL